ncbi:MAG: hypothetical protein ACREV7_12975 [Steroidobacteraceae bacterium]
MELEAQDIESPVSEEKRLSAPRRFKFLTKRRSAELGSTIHFGVFALMLAVTMPRLARSFSPAWDPLDTSWAWMMGYALQHHLQWGKSVVFTYGPLGFLTHSYFYSDHTLWALAATARLTSWFAFGLAFACILRRLAPDNRPSRRTPAAVAIGWTIGATFLHLSAQCAVLGVLLLVLAMAEEDRAAVTVESALSGALLALGALIKATALIVSLFALLVYPALWWYTGRRQRALSSSLLPLLSFLLAFCALWSLASQSFSHLPDYIRGTWEIVRGYTPAMSITGLGIQIISALLILALFAGALMGFHVGGRKVRVAQCLLLGGVAFWAWKEGFTRQDWGYVLHPMTFYGIVLVIASAGTVLVSQEKSRYLTVCIYGAYAVALWCSIQGHPTQRLSYVSVRDNYERYLTLISSQSRRVAEQRSQGLAIQRQFSLRNDVLNAVGHASVNVIPSSLMIVQGYDMHLVASPVIQTYSVYTPYLDQMNASQIWDGRSADKVVYNYSSAGGRYPTFDEPATFRALLTCYRTEYAGSPYAVLSHVTCGSVGMSAAEEPQEGAFGSWIVVPRQASYAAIGVHTTLIGHVMNVFFKADYVRILFRLADGSVKGPYRFIYPVAGDGLFVRYFIGRQSEAVRLFSGNVSGLQRITAIKIATDHPSRDYAKHFAVRFLR